MDLASQERLFVALALHDLAIFISNFTNLTRRTSVTARQSCRAMQMPVRVECRGLLLHVHSRTTWTVLVYAPFWRFWVLAYHIQWVGN